MQKEEIVFKLFILYLQEPNGVLELMRRTSLDMTRVTILKRNIDNKLYPELMLAMTYVKNNWPIRALKNCISPHKAYTKKVSNLAYFWILGSTVYILIYKKERLMKSKKWAPKALKGVLVGYNSHIIYQIHIKDQNKLI